jgi:predicted DNA-binding transcriptional regulator YafY
MKKGMPSFQRVLDVIFKAIIENRWLMLTYENSKGEIDAFPRLVEPYAVFEHLTTANLNMHAYDRSAKRMKCFTIGNAHYVGLGDALTTKRHRPEYNRGSKMYEKALILK